jgi:GR25 family glycosyltransferase involved in LPS biosynthesis
MVHYGIGLYIYYKKYSNYIMDNLYVINLESRIDRMKNFYKIFSDKFNIIRIDAIHNTDSWKGCFESHLKCIKYAKDNNLKYIMVMEDDCMPMNNNWYKSLINIKQNIFDKKNDWDIFLGGSSKTFMKNIHKYDYSDHNIYNIESTYSTYMIVYNHTSYDFFLNSEIILPIDIIWHKKLRCILPIPFLFTTMNSKSDIDDKCLDVKKKIFNNQKYLNRYIKKL